jgi:hypothetical protein
VSHRAHTFIINVQPTFSITPVSILVKNVDRMVSTACGIAVVIKYPIKLVVHRLGRFPGGRYHDFWIDRDMSALAVAHGGMNKKNRTEWDFELWSKLNWLFDPIYALRGHIVHEALKMEDKNLWKRLEKHLLGFIVRARARADDLHGTGL